MASEYELRGVQNPAIIDLVTTEGEHVVLVMTEARPWTGGGEQLEQLDAKLNSYFAYVIDGFFATQYPDYSGRPLRIRLDTVHEPTEAVMEMASVAKGIAEDHGFSFGVRLVEPEEIGRAPWE